MRRVTSEAPITTAELDRLIEDGDVITCPHCGTLNAHAWEDVTVDDAGELYDGETYRVVHIPTASCWEWQCGECRTHWAERGSPLTAEVYTHGVAA